MWKIVACETVGEELKPLLPPGTECKSLQFGLHLSPDKLRRELQEEINASDGVDTIILGYGLCSNGVVGLRSARSRLVIPRMDDCIGIFLGSRAAYQKQFDREPGTYYLTKGWIECGDTPFSEHEKMVGKYGEETARWISRELLKHYTRLALINTGQYQVEHYRTYSRRVADFFELRFEEIDGSTRLLEKLIRGCWDDEFVVVEPEQEITAQMFRKTEPR